MPILPLDTARTFVASIFTRHGASEQVARSVATALVGAEADGLKGHGLSRIPTYLGMLTSGKIDGKAVPTATRVRAATLMIDAMDGFAYPAVDLALAELPAIVRETGIAAAAITRSNHAGALGHHVERLADQGLIALFFANTPEAIAPAGGTKAVYGTNPIAFACPLPGRPAVVVDLALSTVARGNIVAANQKGEAIPEGWALDSDGNPTTDAAKALKGTMAPLGGAKGTTLALMVEVLAAALTGAHLSIEASSFLDEKGPPPGTGQTILAIDPAGFGHGHFGARMTALAGAIEAQAGARLPGQRRLALRTKVAKDGLNVPQDLVDRYGPLP
ncbi:Ldh family oxidoreductase [Phreatobacter aquaticus]|uniref:Ldh family oxidoreductase n=1 Tax=Phreatobacter aquaticus TaxID=2570229 RepID=A0A4D7QIB6_9HYPH|nr:Ldh family oxidoreductase [Phreatobacter aquaticus]QCK86715.1 Ldh family oxidoreductase [Phreatobacter aquaticus]